MAKGAQGDIRDFARQQLRKKQGFRTYLAVYAGVTVLVIAVWFLTTPGSYFWPIWFIFIMGIGAVATGLDAYGTSWSKPITEADVDAEVERLGRRG
ncbi:2TM domain-containing protein [Aquiluna sp. Uisw_065]|jgi:hypothetical protein|uniref:2TM domain-containing protein n=1 Tax=Aquiluna sp. Uisw_065 TaxID=3230967 RepID=UPI0039EA4C38